MWVRNMENLRERLGKMHNDDYKNYWYPAVIKLGSGDNYSKTTVHIANVMGWLDAGWNKIGFRLNDREKRILKMMTSEHWPTLYKAMQARGEVGDGKEDSCDPRRV